MVDLEAVVEVNHHGAIDLSNQVAQLVQQLDQCRNCNSIENKLGLGDKT